MSTSDGSSGSPLERARALIDSTPDVSGPSRLPRVARIYRRVVNRGLADHDHQVNLRLNALYDAMQTQQVEGLMSPEELWQRLQIIGDHIQKLYDIVTRLDQQGTSQTGSASELRAKFSALHDDIGRLHGEISGPDGALAGRINALEAHVQASADDVAARLDSLDAGVHRLDVEQIARPFMADPDALRLTDPDGTDVMGYSSTSLPTDARYAEFEDVFRGSTDMITGRLKPYLPLLGDNAPVLDVGCGRGELLELLRTHGIRARGVDPDPSMIERCRAQDLEVEEIDGVTALRGVEPAGLGAVISVQVVEHVGLDVLRELFLASFDALRPGGVMIAETVNPHSPMALKAFWLDLTHIRPLYPESLLLLAREVGFTSAHIMFPAGTGRLDEDLRDCGEYALVAAK